ncbi:vacuolar membrane zinc transporter [Plectosphaerella plurivora]|uniref:Vacuolar membrane zinc transporter n=1 Tax=Plectosphaerella plurivora TaxID=936078 RepID=A0A9P9ACN7_9PEZI|nr:vacuolar membrane zinc transporter [Plectosphaerella plurivora]
MAEQVQPGTWALDNDTRGWIMCIVSGIACIVGASVIWIDLLICKLPGKSGFKIQESSVFLASALSLSFGVMQFSALYNMLPEAKSFLQEAGYSDQSAGGILMCCFIAGFVGIQVLSRLFHQFMPSHIVDCDHTHSDTKPRSRSLNRKSSRSTYRHGHDADGHGHDHSHSHSDAHSHDHAHGNGNGHTTETTPLLDNAHDEDTDDRPSVPKRARTTQTLPSWTSVRSRAGTIDRRPSMAQVQQRVLSFVKDTKCNCDEEGPCYGYTDPCGQECFKHLNTRTAQSPRRSVLTRASTGQLNTDFGPSGRNTDLEAGRSVSPRHRGSCATAGIPEEPTLNEEPACEQFDQDATATDMSSDDELESQHHHHVPTNAFLSLGLQTSIAIALHKFPEGFITYATNHANPSLGFSVFMALFVHNITEGFAMALPLYMALRSRWRALLWSSLLGGLSQPLGAAIAVLWFRIANHAHMAPSSVAYACMFAITAGIMVSVALQLFVEALSLEHNRNLCTFFAFIGMALLGISSAVAAH